MKQTAFSRLNRAERADLHYARRAQWIVVYLRSNGRQAFAIPSLSEDGKYHVCDGDGCTCPDFRFHGLSGLRIGRGGAHLPCSHVLAVRRLQEVSGKEVA